MREIKFRAWDKVHKRWIWRPRWKLCYNDINAELIQYTGLHDKNGKEIYEGDILKMCPEGDQFGKPFYRICVVKYFPPKFMPTHKDKHVAWSLANRLDFTEVIGNIYENPELLE